MSYIDTIPVNPPKTRQQIMEEDLARLRNQLRKAEQESARKAAAEAARRNAEIKRAMSNVMKGVEEAQNKSEKRMRDALDAANRKNAEQNRLLKQQMQDRINQLGDQTRRQLEQMDANHRKQMQRLSDQIYTDMDRMQRNIYSDMERMQENIYSDMNQMQDALSNQIENVAESVNQLASAVDERFNQTEAEIAEINSNIRNIYQHFHDEDSKAREAVNAAVALLEKVENRTLLDRFAPGYEATDLRGRIQNLINSSATGDALTAMAEEAILKILQTESHAIQEQIKHDALVEAAQQQAERVLSIVNDNRVIKEEIEGGEPIEVENDFWSRGEYSQLENKLKELHNELADRYNPNLNKERIEDILREISKIEIRILQVSNESVTKALLSENRVETIEDVVNVMLGHGWMLKGGEQNPDLNYLGGEEDNDWREGVFAIMEKNTGETITIIVDPDGDDKNKLIVHQDDFGGQTEANLKMQMEIISEDLAKAGYQIPQGSHKRGIIEHPNMASGEHLGSSKASETIRQKVKASEK